MTVLIDPYRSGALNGKITHQPISLHADIVAITHYHEDHGWFGALPGSPEIVDASMTVQGIEFRTVIMPHDSCGGSHMGLSKMIAFDLDGISILHTGDIGRLPSSDELEQLGPIDLLLLPVGGTFTIGLPDALKLHEQLEPRWTIPMHYKTQKVALDMAPRDEFVAALASDSVCAGEGSVLHCKADDRCGSPQIILLDPAL